MALEMANKETTQTSETHFDDADECYVDLSTTMTRDPAEEKWIAIFEAIDQEKMESMKNIQEQIRTVMKCLRKVHFYRILFSLLATAGLFLILGALSVIFYQKSGNLAKFSGCRGEWTPFKQLEENISVGKLRYERSRCSSHDYAPGECPLECNGGYDFSKESLIQILCRKHSFGELDPSLVRSNEWKNDFSLVKLVNPSHILRSYPESDKNNIVEQNAPVENITQSNSTSLIGLKKK